MTPLYQRPLDLGADIAMCSATKFAGITYKDMYDQVGYNFFSLPPPLIFDINCGEGVLCVCLSFVQYSAGGHGDATGGILAVKTPELGQRLYFQQNAEGSGLAPFESWLLLRGLKTMALRMERSVENAIAIAQFLAKHPLVKRVNFPYPLKGKHVLPVVHFALSFGSHTFSSALQKHP